MLGVGIDIIETDRMEKSLLKKGFKEKVFLPNEIEYCQKYSNFVERYAGMFACKEAVMKACEFAGQYFLNIEIVHQENGAPKIILHGIMAEKFDQEKILISISHINSTAVALAVRNG